MSGGGQEGDVPDTSFVPQLDARQRAMLAEMGVRVWAPRAGVAPAPVAGPAAQVPVARPALPSARAAAPAVVPVVATPVPAPTPQADGSLPGTRPPGVEHMDWPALEAAVAGCQACGLCQSRKNTVFGAGDTGADWMVIGEAPGEHEDRQGEPFVGAAGQLLDNMLRAVGRSRQSRGEAGRGIYIANVLKCRPPANRNPQPDEVAQCEPFLARQVALVRPKIILAMGRFAVQSILKTEEPIGRLRGRVHRYEGVPVIVTYHPAYLLRTPGDKAKAWADLCLALEAVGTPPR